LFYIIIIYLRLYLYHFFGLRFNDKIFIYLIAIILFLSHPPSTIYYSLCGIFSGLLYLTKSGFQSQEVPIWLSQFCEKYFGPLISLSPPIIEHSTQPVSPANPRRPATNVFDFDTVHTYYSSPQAPRQPSQQHIEYLMSMGVDRERAVQVLMRCDDELNLAIESLFPSV